VQARATDGLRFSITPKRSAPTEPLLLTFLAINQLTTMAAPFTGALFELPTVNSPKMSAFGPDSLVHWLAIGWFWPLSRHSRRRPPAQPDMQESLSRPRLRTGSTDRRPLRIRAWVGRM